MILYFDLRKMRLIYTFYMILEKRFRVKNFNNRPFILKSRIVQENIAEPELHYEERILKIKLNLQYLENT